ncbi:MAG: 50S ribosomal protein L29 [Sphingobacteriaceae bacterium]|jgi:large subunit ribosomal protein L29|nr:50S ribosomal protein L29 [Sphingobacteriaceae bacterium]
MKNTDIVALSTAELQGLLKEEKGALNKLKLNHSISPLENPIRIRDSRKTVARVSTELTKRNNTSK